MMGLGLFAAAGLAQCQPACTPIEEPVAAPPVEVPVAVPPPPVTEAPTTTAAPTTTTTAPDVEVVFNTREEPNADCTGLIVFNIGTGDLQFRNYDINGGATVLINDEAFPAGDSIEVPWADLDGVEGVIYSLTTTEPGIWFSTDIPTGYVIMDGLHRRDQIAPLYPQCSV
jgi:hypothetical protein